MEFIGHIWTQTLSVPVQKTVQKAFGDENYLRGSYRRVRVVAITALFAALVRTAATIRFVIQITRIMRNKGNALTIGFVRAFLVFSENKLRQIRVKRRF